MKKYFPIGSVVLLKDAEKRLMVTGYGHKGAESEKVWDYCAVPYPEGQIDPESLCLFDEAQIDSFFFVGHQDAESRAFHGKLAGEEQ